MLIYYVEGRILFLLAAAKSLNLTLILQLCHCNTFAVLSPHRCSVTKVFKANFINFQLNFLAL